MLDGTQLRQVRVVPRDNQLADKLQQTADKFPLDGLPPEKDSTFAYSPGPCQHNKKFACAFLPCAVPLFYIGGELLFGAAVFCILIVYLVDNTSRSKRSSLVAYVLSVLVFQLASMYCLIPFLCLAPGWHKHDRKSVFNVGLIFIYNVFIVLSGGVGLLQFKQMQHEEAEFLVNMEYILFVSYPVVCQLTLTAVSGNVFGWPVAPFFCVVFGFLNLRVFYSPSRSSLIFCNAVHRPGEDVPPDRFILGSLEKTLLLLNLVTVPGSMFIVINLLELLQLTMITWVKLLLCGLLPVFLCTCLDIKDEMDFLEFSGEIVSKVKWGSGLGSLVLVCFMLWYSGSVGAQMLPVILGNTVCGLLIVAATRQEKWKKYRHVLLVALSLLSLLGLYTLPWSLEFQFQFLSFPLWGLTLLLALVGCISVACVFVSSGSNCEWLNPLMVIHSLGFVLCENVLATEKLYPVYFMLGSMLFMGYICQRLHSVGMLHGESMLVCIAVHSSKLPLCLSIMLPFTPSSSALLPGVFLVSPAFLMFLFAVVVTKIVKAREDLSSSQVLKLCVMAAAVTVGVYDVLVLPLWFLTTHRIPTNADVLAGVLFIWGSLCVKLSHVHYAHNLLAKRLNILVLCEAIVLGIIQPELNLCRVLEAFLVYVVSLLYPAAFSVERIMLAEELSLSWLIIVGLSVLMAVLAKVINLEQISWPQRVLITFLVGLPPGLKAASIMLSMIRSPLVCLLYGVSSAVTVYILVASWKPVHGKSRSNLSFPYLCHGGCFVACLSLETLNPLGQDKTYQGEQGSSVMSPSISYHLFLHLLLGLALKRDRVSQRASLEEMKGKLPSGLVLQSSSFFSNISLSFAFLLILFCSPAEYWDWWVSFGLVLLLFLRPEGAPYIRGSRVQFTPALPAAVALAVCMYSRTFTEAFPTQITWLSITGYVLEMVFLVCSSPTYVVLVHALWRGEISLVEQEAVMFVAPSNVVLLVYCSTLSARILGFVGIAAVYWMFYYVQVSANK